MIESVKNRLDLYAKMIYSGCRMTMWLYADAGELYRTNSEYAQELQMLFVHSGCMEFAWREGKCLNGPFVMSDILGIVWLGEFVGQTAEERMLAVAGPVFFTAMSVDQIKDTLRNAGFSVQDTLKYTRVLQNIPVVGMDLMNQYARMLHTAVSGEVAEDTEIIFQHAAQSLQGKSGEKSTKNEKNRDYDRLYGMERMLMQCIRDGNRKYKEVFEQIHRSQTNSEQMEDSQRMSRNLLIVLISQCTDAAIEGGVPPRIAKTAQRDYMQKVDAAKTVTELISLRMEMLEMWIDLVNEYQTVNEVSRPIKMCCAYIKEHLTEDLTLKKIAGEIGYTEYYLSRKFQKETGIKILDYIKELRIEYAKIWLSTTDKSVLEIGEQLQFGEGAYFGRVFKERVGVSPTKFRSGIRKVSIS